jgi:hypothetical protein
MGDANNCLYSVSGDSGKGDISISGRFKRSKSGCQRARFSSLGSSSSFN